MESEKITGTTQDTLMFDSNIEEVNSMDTVELTSVEQKSLSKMSITEGSGQVSATLGAGSRTTTRLSGTLNSHHADEDIYIPKGNHYLTCSIPNTVIDIEWSVKVSDEKSLILYLAGDKA